jgi:hypothetical protein
MRCAGRFRTTWWSVVLVSVQVAAEGRLGLMSTKTQRTCPSCGNELSGAMEFCPVCLLRKGLAGGVESGESSVSKDTVKPTTPDQPAQRFEHYQLVTGKDGKPVELGRGAMGVTYKAFDIDLHCPVTLKVISEKYLGDESAQLRFLREAQADMEFDAQDIRRNLHNPYTGNETGALTRQGLRIKNRALQIEAEKKWLREHGFQDQ